MRIRTDQTEPESQRVLPEKDQRRQKQEAIIGLCDEKDRLYCLRNAEVRRSVPGVEDQERTTKIA